MPIEISEGETSAEHSLSLNDEVVVRLPENPTTGYRWEITHSGAGELALMDDRFVSGTAAAPGAGGQRLLRYVGRKPGKVTVKAVLKREWESPETSLGTRVFSIDVR